MVNQCKNCGYKLKFNYVTKTWDCLNCKHVVEEVKPEENGKLSNWV